MAQERVKKLSETVQAYVLVREAAELSQWIKDKEQHAQIEDVGEDLEQVCTNINCHLGDLVEVLLNCFIIFFFFFFRLKCFF